MKTRYSEDDNITLPIFQKRLGVFVEELWLDAVTAGDQIANELQEYARAHHPWQNRTGDTEATTDADVTTEQYQLAITLSAGTSYAQFLEFAKQGKWSWLWPAMIAMQSRMLQIWVQVMSR